MLTFAILLFMAFVPAVPSALVFSDYQESLSQFKPRYLFTRYFLFFLLFYMAFYVVLGCIHYLLNNLL